MKQVHNELTIDLGNRKLQLRLRELVSDSAWIYVNIMRVKARAGSRPKVETWRIARSITDEPITKD